MTVRIIQVGMGGWGRDWATNVLPRVKAVTPVARVDSFPGSLALARSELGVPAEQCFDSLEAAIAGIDADAVLATVAVSAHVPVALAAIAAGKHVLLEKPFAMSENEARQVVDAADAAGRVLMISQNYRFFPAVQAAAQLVREQALGSVGAVSLDFRRNITSVRPDHAYATLGDPLLFDMAIHHFDLMRAVLDQEAGAITCHAWNPPWSPMTGRTTATAAIEFAGGPVVSYRGSWVSRGPDTPWAGEWRMECARGEIVWTSRGGGMTDQLAADRVVVRPLVGPERAVTLPKLTHVGRAGVLSAFAEAIRTGGEPPCSGRDNLKTVAMMNAAIASATIGRTVDLAATATVG